MNLFTIRNTRVSRRILLLFQFMSVPLVILFITFLITIHWIHETERRIFSQNMAGIRAAYAVETSILSMRGLMAYYIMERDPQWIDTFDHNVNKFNHAYSESFRMAKTDAERTILSNIALDFNLFQKQHREILALLDSGNSEKAEDLLLNVSNPYFNDIYNGCEKLIHSNDRTITASLADMERYTARAQVFVYILCFCFILIGIFLTVIISRSIVKPLREMEMNGRAVGAESTSPDELERVKNSFNLIVAEMKKNQEKVIRGEKRAAIGELAAGLSHELNNPIGIIAGFSEVLMQRKSLKSGDRRIVSDIHREAMRCRNLLGEFLAFARSPQPVMRRLNMARVIRKTIRLVSGQREFAGITFVFDRWDTAVRAMIDPLQISQVFMNLFMNACHAMEGEGTITLSLYSDGGTVIRVRDSGPGISGDALPRIFIPFYSTRTKGTGLGLSVCREIVEKHGGTITAGNGPERYAEFIITLPES